jgi:hypothetical protein
VSIKYRSDGNFMFYGDSKYQILSVDERHPGLARLGILAIPARSRPIMLQSNFYGPARHKVILG